MFLAGWWLSFAKAHPFIAKAFTGSIGLIIGTINRIITLLYKCPLGIGLIGALILLGWNILFLTINLSLVTSGVGIPFIFLISGLEYYLENLFVDKFVASACDK